MAEELLRGLGELLAARLREAFSARGDLKPTEARTLLALGRERALTNAEVGRAVGSNSAHVSRTIDLLRERGLVDRQEDHTGRKRLNFLTDAGREAAAEIAARQKELLAPAATDLAPDEQRLLKRLLEKLSSAPRRAALEPRIAVASASATDLGWLMTQLPTALPLTEDARRALLRRRTEEVDRHLRVESNQAWIATNWGQRVGGCALTWDLEHEEDGLIELLHVSPALEVEAGRPLLRAALEAARGLTYAHVTLRPIWPSVALEELIDATGFQPFDTEISVDLGPGHKLGVWRRTLAPPLRR